jgi:hypothetical protein
MIEDQAGGEATKPHDLTSADGMLELIRKLRAMAPTLRANGFHGQLSRLRDDHARVINCKSGIGNNIIEFCRHVLGQRQTAQSALRGYDAGLRHATA